jgi:hypothetical protein
LAGADEVGRWLGFSARFASQDFLGMTFAVQTGKRKARMRLPWNRVLKCQDSGFPVWWQI